MIPASTVNAKNYHLLGNRITGESRASRMKRVNAHTPYKPSLIDRNPPKVHKIKPTKPLNLGTSHGSSLETFVLPSVVSGAAAFASQALIAPQWSKAKGSKVVGRNRTTGMALLAAGIGTVAGMVTAGNLNYQKLGIGDPFISKIVYGGPIVKAGNDSRDNYALGIGIPLGFLFMAMAGEGVKNRTKTQRNEDLLRAGVLSAPAVGLSFVSNAIYTVPMYLSSLVGVMAARKYRKI